MSTSPPSAPDEPSPPREPGIRPRSPRPEEIPRPTPSGGTPTRASGLAFAAALLWACGGLGPSPARPQTGQAPPSAPPEVMEDTPVETPGAGSLSEELGRSGGVIAPPDPGVDPGLVRPAPDAAATMPVIPPPGSSPGGDPNLRPPWPGHGGAPL